MTKTGYILLFFVGLLTCACNKNEKSAAYLKIEAFEWTPGVDGIQSTKITDGWVYVDNEFLGAFDLPKTIPVLKSGENSVVIDPGIKENGISALPDLYTFYKRYSTTVTLVPGETTTVNPETTYDYDKVKQPYNFEEFFELGAHLFKEDIDGNPNTKVEITNTVVKEGNASGMIYLDTDNDLIIVGSPPISDPPTTGLAAYIEMDYKNEIPFVVGIYGYTETDQLVFTDLDLGVNPKSDWNKIYFNISQKLKDAAIVGSAKYRIVIRAQIPKENGEFTRENAEIYIDNVKLVSF